jgi:flagellar protein FlgJ
MPAAVDRSSKLYEACVEFEALFLKQMLAAMRKTVQKTGLLDGGMAQDIFEDMLYDEYAKSMARNAGFGLADTVYLQLTSAQRAALSADGLQP